MSMCPLIFCRVRMSTRRDMRVSAGDPAVLGRLAREALGWEGFALETVLVPGTGIEQPL